MTGTVKALNTHEIPGPALSDAAGPALHTVTMTLRDGAPFVVRAAQRFSGVAISVAALALLVLPFGADTATAVLCKMMVALTLGFVGAALWQAGAPVATPELEIDMVRREVRLVRWSGSSRQQTATAAFSSLGHAEIVGNRARLWAQDETLIAEVSMPGESATWSLMRALQDEGVPIHA